jgi:hypothetical protein
MQDRKRNFYGWGYEGDVVPPEEIREFEQAWTRLLGVSGFEPVPFPTEDSIKLRAPRVTVPESVKSICSIGKHDRLYHTYGASTVDVARAIRGGVQESSGRRGLSPNGRRYRQLVSVVRRCQPRGDSLWRRHQRCWWRQPAVARSVWGNGVDRYETFRSGPRS